jgi:antitoxin VapB
MSLNIKNEEVVRLAEWICERTGETKTEAIRVSLEQRAATLGRETYDVKHERIQRFVREVCEPKYGKFNEPLTKEQVEDILGFGPDGV